jgi:hypothetical protein
MSLFHRSLFRRRAPRVALSLGFLATVLVLACDLDNGEDFNRPEDPTVIIDPTTVGTAVFVDPPNVPADGESYSTIHGRITLDGQPAVGVPTLFYSEWGTVFTACGTPTTVNAAAFQNAIITGENGEASTLIQAPVLPNLYSNEQESNTIAAFFLIKGTIFRAINNQNIWQVNLASVQCPASPPPRRTVTVTFAARNGTLPVSACSSVNWTSLTSNATVTNTTLCDSRGRATAVVQFNPGTTEARIQVVASFEGAGLNECVLDTDRSLDVVGVITVPLAGSCRH